MRSDLVLDKRSEEFFRKYAKYKLSIDNIDEYSEKIDWEEKPKFTLFLVEQDKEYDRCVIKNVCDVKEFIDECKFKEEAEIYLFPNYKKTEIDAVQNYLQKRYERYFDNLLASPFLKKVTILNSLYFLTIVSILMIVSVKYQWVDLGLPLEALPNGNVLEDYLDILALVIIESMFKRMGVIITIYALVILFFIVITWKIEKYKYPSVKKYLSFYFKKTFFIISTVVTGFIFIISLSIIIEHFSKKDNNFIMEAILSSTLYPKVVQYNKKTYLISHMNGKYAYIQDINATATDNNCSKIQPFIKSLNLKPQSFIAIKYDDLNTSFIEDVKDFCKRNSK